MGKALCNAYVAFSHASSGYSGFEIVTIIEIESRRGGTKMEEVKTYEEFAKNIINAIDDPFYRVLAIYKGKKEKRIMGDFFNVCDAVNYLEDLTGSKVYIYSI